MVIGDRYELDDFPLGQGGMGAVYRGHDKHLDRKVAVKILHLPVPDEELERRFIREARILARLEHPGAPTLYDFGAHERRLYQVMQFIAGVTVADLVSEYGPLPVPWAAAIAAQACAVLAAAHALSICHRDLKPTNLMLCPDGSVKVLDFGLAMLRDADVAQSTRSGQLLGTPAYMSPEQIQRGQAGPQSDLYALGCVLHEMLTGRQLFTGPTEYAVFEKQVKERPPTVTGVPRELARLVDDLLEKRPECRPADASTLFERLQEFAVDLPVLPGFLNPPSVPSPARMYARVLGRVLA
ncbi:serine/threonine protein kinase [Thermopolyspora flexuosa]|jgi:non-specific serine/threonine protein kinase|uniref:non-specific serine/threonine protein kinase n=1 Tax=Thermopolyspora flexuosa TaxID=103836 RepID=A0A543J1L0_9ACTN|nr:serine/threonine-protein kinase [Thermopolyspora flexuosa]TQM76707.1 non-specific serine/threonine protein kinase [Thermopolyspora flexuosa]GGM86176.1 serine/threonine protein kinase [Thermopolyspora flexuosa]